MKINPDGSLTVIGMISHEIRVGALQRFGGFVTVTQRSLAVSAQARLQAGQRRYEGGFRAVVWSG